MARSLQCLGYEITGSASLFRFLHRLIAQLNVSPKFILICTLKLSVVIFITTILVAEIGEVEWPIISSVTGHSSRPARACQVMEVGQLNAEGFAQPLLAAKRPQDIDAIIGDGVAAGVRKHALFIEVEALISLISHQPDLIPDLGSHSAMTLIASRFPDLFDRETRIEEKATAVGRAGLPDHASWLQGGLVQN